MKKAFACFLSILLMTAFCLTALAGDDLYIANPNPQDRLHLRTEPAKSSKSLGKYYNGAPMERIGAFNHNGWVQVRVGLGGNSLTGYMNQSYLSSKATQSAMPQYAAVKPVKAYQQPSLSSKSLTIAGGRLLSLMGFSDGWWHLLAHTGESEGNYTCFVPADADGILPLGSDPFVKAHISNPDPTDRLHLRTAPDQNAESLGKYYNGAPVRILEDQGEWARVDILGVEGWMMTRYLAIGDSMKDVKYAGPQLQTVEGGAMLHTEPHEEAAVSAVNGDYSSMQVIGIVNELWYHVWFYEENCGGYFRADDLWEGNG